MKNIVFEQPTVDQQIQVRYAKEAKSECCLSCGGAVEHASITPGETVVDLGSGRGNEVIKAARKAAPEGVAIGIDFTPEMLETAEMTAKKLKVDNASFKLGSIDEIPLANNSCDVIISNCTINHAANKHTVYSEIHRTLKPGGRFVVSDIISETVIPPEIANDPEAVAGCYGGAITQENYIQAIGNAGFSDVEILEESQPYDKGGVMVRSITIKSIK